MKNKKAKHIKKAKKGKVITVICLIIFIISMLYLVYYFYNGYKDKKSITDLQKEIPPIVTGEQATQRMQKIQDLQQENNDIKGWIEIADTKINYPILQTTDNQYYLTHDYKKEKNRYGSIFLKNTCDINNNNSNLIIYGHNMKDKEMFNNLLQYQNQEFYEQHKIVNITTENEEREYEIIAVFKSRVFYQNEKNVFRYYSVTSFENEIQYDDYISNVKKMQLYDTGITANYGEQLLTLITCEYSQENGRMVVVAKATM